MSTSAKNVAPSYAPMELYVSIRMVATAATAQRAIKETPTMDSVHRHSANAPRTRNAPATRNAYSRASASARRPTSWIHKITINVKVPASASHVALMLSARPPTLRSACARLASRAIHCLDAQMRMSAPTCPAPTAPTASTKRVATSASAPRASPVIPTRAAAFWKVVYLKALVSPTRTVQAIWPAWMAAASVPALVCYVVRMPIARQNSMQAGVGVALDSSKMPTATAYRNVKMLFAAMERFAYPLAKDPRVSAHRATWAILSQAAAVAQISALPPDPAMSDKFALMDAARNAAKASSVALAPPATRTTVNASASLTLWAIPTYSACLPSNKPNVRPFAVRMLTANTELARAAAPATPAPTEIPTKDAAPRTKTSANRTAVDPMPSVALPAIRLAASAHKASAAILMSAARI